MDLNLPKHAVSDRVSRVPTIGGGERATVAELEGAGCIRHIFLVLNHPHRTPASSRKAILRIYFDDEPVPYVEAPAGDFFGVMHGEGYYDINSKYLSVKAWNGYNCYFPMPFARSARVELEAAPEGTVAYLQVDWHRFPDQSMTEERRFCARWRREMPASADGDDFLILDADGPGQLLGFVYGVRLLDDSNRWSHGGADNIYIDGAGRYPAFIRGIGGEDCFGAGYGGNLHPVDSHLYEGMPFYTHDDQGLSRPAPRVVGYRFYDQDSIQYEESIQFRFGCMANDICSTVYWYQEGAVRPFFEMPGFDKLLPGEELPVGSGDLALPDRGGWLVAGPIGRDALHKTDISSQSWTAARSHHGFVDFNHCYRSAGHGVAHRKNVDGLAQCVVRAPRATTASLQLAWDEMLTIGVNGDSPIPLGDNRAFRTKTIDVPLVEGENYLTLTLSNESGPNRRRRGWAFAFRCTTSEGEVLLPEPERQDAQPPNASRRGSNAGDS
ncbi:MAG: DUF2961 domain-containing protein [Lentisphaeria bacterium]|jgi:hypothetical protein|nr:DUF2961 domain-containing protein [Lentisphaeria bacterium]